MLQSTQCLSPQWPPPQNCPVQLYTTAPTKHAPTFTHLPAHARQPPPQPRHYATRSPCTPGSLSPTLTPIIRISEHAPALPDAVLLGVRFGRQLGPLVHAHLGPGQAERPHALERGEDQELGQRCGLGREDELMPVVGGMAGDI